MDTATGATLLEEYLWEVSKLRPGGGVGRYWRRGRHVGEEGRVGVCAVVQDSDASW